MTSETLFGELWDDDQNTSVNALQAHVSRLRQTLNQLAPGTGNRLKRRGGGYSLAWQAGDEFDAQTFCDIVSSSRRESAQCPDAHNDRLREALSMWRGTVFGGEIGGLVCRSVAVKVAQARISALETFFENEISLGRHHQVLAELGSEHSKEPLNERLAGQLMRAMYAAGRQAEALSVYHDIRGKLSDELGVYPSPELRQIASAILSHDPSLAAARATHPEGDAGAATSDDSPCDCASGAASAPRSARSRMRPGALSTPDSDLELRQAV